MRPGATSPEAAKGVAVAAISWLSAFVMAGFIESPSARDAGGVVGRIVGTARRELAGTLLVEADNYFHRGARHQAKRLFTDWFQRALEGLNPQAHRHADGAEVAEIMPWLRAATFVDPGQVEPYLVAAYWLEKGLKRFDAVEQVYRDAFEEHSGDYRVALGWATCRLRQGRLDTGTPMLDSALRKWPAPLPADDNEAIIDRRYMLHLRGILHAYDGRLAEARDFFQQALRLAPGHIGIRRDLEQLASAPESMKGNAALLARFIRQPEHTCAREGGAEHGEHDHEHSHADADGPAPTD